MKLATPTEGTDACNHAAAASPSRIPRAWEEAAAALLGNARESGPSTVLLLPSLKAGRRNRAAEVAVFPSSAAPTSNEERRAARKNDARAGGAPLSQTRGFPPPGDLQRSKLSRLPQGYPCD